MTTVDLVALFNSLEAPGAAADQTIRYAALPIPGFENHRIGKDAHGRPALLVSVSTTPERAWPAPIVLEHLAVLHHVSCTITNPNGETEEKTFTVISCTNSDRALNTYFLRVTAAIVASLQESPSNRDVARAIESLVELFHALAEPPRKSVQGLWAELFVIARSPDPSALIQAWHVTPEDRYDFSARDQRIEVKSAVGPVRQHHFSLEQLHPPSGASLLVASLFVERSARGTSIAELVDEIRSHPGFDLGLLLRVDRAVALTLGNNWRSAQEDRFDRQLAEESLRLYDPAAVPSISSDLPDGVSDVRFKSDLTGCEAAEVGQCRSLGGLFAAALR